MAIKFGDTLENQNTAYPIVDIVGENVAGIFIVDSFIDANLEDIPVASRRNGSFVIDKATSSIYIYDGTASLADGNNLWNDADGTSWSSISGDNTLGSDSNFSNGTLQDNSPAVSGFTTGTTITYAIDKLNETLGSLVPAGPQPFSSLVSSLTAASVFPDVQGSNARLVPLDSLGGDNVVHATNNSGETYTAGSGSNVVNWDTSTSINETLNITGSDLVQEVLQLKLNDETLTLPTPDSANASTTNTLAGVSNSYGGAISLTINHDSFPTSGDAQDFYDTGVSAILFTVSATIVDGFHKIRLEDSDNNGIEDVWYRASNSTNIGMGSAASAVLTDAGTNVYLSGQKHYSQPTIKLGAGVVSNIVPTDGLVYGATVGSTTDNTFLTFDAGDHFPAMGSVDYDDVLTSVDDIYQGFGWAISGTQTQIPAVTMGSGKRGMLLLAEEDSLPAMDLHSIHGNSNNNGIGLRNTSGGSDIATTTSFAVFDKGNVSTSLYYVNEHSLTTTGLGSTNGIRVAETSDATAYDDDPDGTFNTWSEQYGNGAGSLDINDKDAITVANGSEIRLRHELTNYTASTYQFAGNAANFSTRTSSDKQFATYEFTCTTTGLQFVYLKFKGSLASTGKVLVKMFDSGATNSLQSANSSTNGWLDCSQAATGSPVPNNGGVTTGGNLSKTSTSSQSIKLTAGQATWSQGTNNKIYVRVILPQNGYVQELGLASS